MKKAVLVGVRYTEFDEIYRKQAKVMTEEPPLGSSAKLPTPHKDVDTMAKLLVGKCALRWQLTGMTYE